MSANMGGDPAKKRALVREREAFVWDLKCKGYSQRRIAEETGKHPHLQGPISQVAVHKILQRIDKRVLAKTATEAEQIKREHTLILQRSLEDLRDAYEKSMQPQVSKKSKKTLGGTAKKAIHATVDEIGQRTNIGDHNILREMRETLADIRKIWGADAPIKTDNTHHGSMMVGTVDLSKLSDHELTQLHELQQKLIGSGQTPNATLGPTSAANESTPLGVGTGA